MTIKDFIDERRKKRRSPVKDYMAHVLGLQNEQMKRALGFNKNDVRPRSMNAEAFLDAVAECSRKTGEKSTGDKSGLYGEDDGVPEEVLEAGREVNEMVGYSSDIVEFALRNGGKVFKKNGKIYWQDNNILRDITEMIIQEQIARRAQELWDEEEEEGLEEDDCHNCARNYLKNNEYPCNKCEDNAYWVWKDPDAPADDKPKRPWEKEPCKGPCNFCKNKGVSDSDCWLCEDEDWSLFQRELGPRGCTDDTVFHPCKGCNLRYGSDICKQYRRLTGLKIIYLEKNIKMKVEPVPDKETVEKRIGEAIEKATVVSSRRRTRLV